MGHRNPQVPCLSTRCTLLGAPSTAGISSTLADTMRRSKIPRRSQFNPILFRSPGTLGVPTSKSTWTSKPMRKAVRFFEVLNDHGSRLRAPCRFGRCGLPRSHEARGRRTRRTLPATHVPGSASHASTPRRPNDLALACSKRQSTPRKLPLHLLSPGLGRPRPDPRFRNLLRRLNLSDNLCASQLQDSSALPQSAFASERLIVFRADENQRIYCSQAEIVWSAKFCASRTKPRSVLLIAIWLATA